MSVINVNLYQTWAFNGSDGEVTEAVNASFVQALAEYYGITEPVNGSWVQAIAEFLGITLPENGNWIKELAIFYGATEPVNGSWLYALAVNAEPPITELVWNLNNTEWQNETEFWNN